MTFGLVHAAKNCPVGVFLGQHDPRTIREWLIRSKVSDIGQANTFAVINLQGFIADFSSDPFVTFFPTGFASLPAARYLILFPLPSLSSAPKCSLS